jgi:hypothetical protein
MRESLCGCLRRNLKTGMIVQPDFTRHWKTVQLRQALGGDRGATDYILNLWGHCQTSRKSAFQKLTADALAAICGYDGDRSVFFTAMKNCGFIRVKSDLVTVHEWDKYNASLVSSWRNGKKGGRKKKPAGSDRVNPDQTAGLPTGGAIREEKIREEKIHTPATGAVAPGVLISAESSDSKPADLILDSTTPQEIYAAYPRKIDPKAAQRAILKAMRLKPAKYLLERTTAYAVAMRGTEVQFIPHPATWFNRERYDQPEASWNPTGQRVTAPQKAENPEPRDWRNRMRQHYPNATILDDSRSWQSLPRFSQESIIGALAEIEKRSAEKPL